jgi:hypothetical protein
MNDPVNFPSHYIAGAVECIDAIEAAMTPMQFISYCRGQAIKYVWRSPLKGSEIEDLRKAHWYLQRAIDRLQQAKHELQP